MAHFSWNGPYKVSGGFTPGSGPSFCYKVSGGFTPGSGPSFCYKVSGGLLLGQVPLSVIRSLVVYSWVRSLFLL